VLLSELYDDGAMSPGGGSSSSMRHGDSDRETESGSAASGSETGSVGHDRGW
jgi:hypothetical protein